MAVYLGTSGLIQLSRVGEGSFFSTMDPGDVDPTEKRFSFDFPNGTFITGDRLTIKRVNANGTPSSLPLDFVAGHGYSDGTWYVNVDPIGGLRLYSTWADSLSGRKGAALALATPAGSYQIRVDLVDTKPHCFGQVLDYTLSTQRDNVDVTSLGDAFAERFSTLISGSGQMTAYWDWLPAACDTGEEVELAQYFHQLILRQQLGSEFKADFYVKRAGAEPIGSTLSSFAAGTSIYYSVSAVVTGVSIGFSPAAPVQSVIQFATTGPIQMLYGIPSAYLLLQESGSFINTEAGDGRLVLDGDL